jgi:hypothetical protein
MRSSTNARLPQAPGTDSASRASLCPEQQVNRCDGAKKWEVCAYPWCRERRAGNRKIAVWSSMERSSCCRGCTRCRSQGRSLDTAARLSTHLANTHDAPGQVVWCHHGEHQKNSTSVEHGKEALGPRHTAALGRVADHVRRTRLAAMRGNAHEARRAAALVVAEELDRRDHLQYSHTN